MNFFHRKIEHPLAAFAVCFFLGVVLAKYGMRDGSLLVFDLFAGIGIYKIVTG